jgi:hypothetical protein
MRKPPDNPWAFAARKGRSYIVTPEGRIIVDPGKHSIVPFTLTTEPETIRVPAATDMGNGLLAGGVNMNVVGLDLGVASMPIDRYPFEICFSAAYAQIASGPLTGQQTDEFTVKIFDAGQRSTIMNGECHARTICGGFGTAGGGGWGTSIESAGGRPFIWKETVLLDPGNKDRCIFVQFRNLLTVDIDVRFILHGVRYYSAAAFEDIVKTREAIAGKGRISWPYFYTLDQGCILLAANQSRELDLRMTDDSGVELFTMTKQSTAPFLWRLQEKVGKRFLDNSGPAAGGGGIHSDFGWGDAETPFIPYESLYMEQDDKLMLTLTNSLYDAQNRIFITLHARKIRKLGTEQAGEYGTTQ